MTLLVRPSPRDHEGPNLEGPNAFLLRVAEDNMLAPQQVQEMGLRASWPLMDALLDRVQPLRRKCAAYCPCCLTQNGVGRLGWELTFADACAKCGRWLVDTCHRCGELLTWDRAALLSCHCGQSLLGQLSPLAPANLVHLSRMLEAAVAGCWPPRGDSIVMLDANQLSDLIRLLGSYGSACGHERPQKRVFSTSLAASWPIATVAAEVIADWPHGFEQYLAQLARRSTATEKTGSLKQVFGGFYWALYHGLKDAAFNFVRERFERYALEHWTGALARRNRRIDAELLFQAKWEPASQARARLGVSRRRLEAMREFGEVRAAQRTTASGRTFVVVHRDDVDANVAAVASEHTLAETAALLGLTRSRLAALLPHICPLASQSVQGRSPWSIPGSWVEGWRARLEELPVVARSTDVEPFGDVLRFRVWPVARIARLIKDVATEAIPIAGRLQDVHGMPAIAFDTKTLASWCEASAPERAAMTVPQVAERMGIKEQVAYLLVRRGLLESTRNRGGSRPAASVSKSQLDRFNNAYVWGRELARQLTKSPRATAVFLAERGVKPVSGGGVDGGRQLLYRRGEVPWDSTANRNGGKP